MRACTWVYVHPMEVVAHSARGGGVVEARDQRVQLVLLRAAQDLLPVEVVPDVVKVVVPACRARAMRT